MKSFRNLMRFPIERTLASTAFSHFSADLYLILTFVLWEKERASKGGEEASKRDLGGIDRQSVRCSISTLFLRSLPTFEPRREIRQKMEETTRAEGSFFSLSLSLSSVFSASFFPQPHLGCGISNLGSRCWPRFTGQVEPIPAGALYIGIFWDRKPRIGKDIRCGVERGRATFGKFSSSCWTVKGISFYGDVCIAVFNVSPDDRRRNKMEREL